MRTRECWLLFTLYFILGLFVTLNHEPWRDELQAWMIAKNSPSIQALFVNSTYEGHHNTWFLILYFFTGITESISAYSIFHFCITAVGIFILIRCAPFSGSVKWLLVFNYFFFYEYGVIARNYGLSLPAVFLFCTLFPFRKTHFLVLIIILSALLHINIYAFFLSVCLFSVLVIDKWESEKFELRDKCILFLYFIAATISIWEVIPPTDTGFASEWNFSLRKYFKSHVDILWNSILPIPKVSGYFWLKNTFDFHNPALEYFLKCICLIPVLFFVIKKLFKSYISILFIGLLYGVLCLFSTVKFFGEIRHHGYLFIGFIAILWIQNHLPATSGGVTLSMLKKLNSLISGRMSNYFFNSILIFQMFIALGVSAMDIAYDFSGSKRLSEFIVAENLSDLEIIGDIDFAVSPVSAYLDKDIFYPSSDTFGTFIIWNQKRLRLHDKRTNASILHKADSLKIVKKEDILVLLNYELKSEILNKRKDMELIYASPVVMIGFEEYFLYYNKYK